MTPILDLTPRLAESVQVRITALRARAVAEREAADRVAQEALDLRYLAARHEAEADDLASKLIRGAV